MELLTSLIDIVLHLDRHVSALLATWHLWFYAILFVVIFTATLVQRRLFGQAPAW